MKLATITPRAPVSLEQSKDGQLVLVDDAAGLVAPINVKGCTSLRCTLERWSELEPELQSRTEDLKRKRLPGTLPFRDVRFMAPLPRTWALFDASAYLSHVILTRKARGALPPDDLKTIPLMYQGASDGLAGPHDEIKLLNNDYGLDFEGEIAAILGEVACGTPVTHTKDSIKLLMLMNDVSYRNLIPREVQTGFGFLQSKPPSSFSPFAITPDELGNAWHDGKVHLPLRVTLNGKVIGEPLAGDMHFSFHDLIAHAAKTRSLSAGTILGGGTVSNEAEHAGVACLVERRMREQLTNSAPVTEYLKVGDRIRIEMYEGQTSFFGAIDQVIA